MKNKFNISGFIIQFFAVMMFFAASQPAFGQDYIRSTTDLLSDTSIVRTVDGDTVLMYNEFTLYTSSVSYFSLVNSGSSSFTKWQIDPVHVNDFEVVGKMVYFCGYIIVDDAKKAVFGVFPLSQFGNSPLKCKVLDDIAELRKLDYYEYTEGPSYNQHYEDHIVMTGAREVRSDVIVDVIVGASTYAPPFTLCATFYSDNDYESFDDVAATEKHVVVSTRTKVEGVPVVDFWQFDKPTATWTYISHLNVGHLVLGSPVAETPVILEHIEAENYAAAFKVSGYSLMALLKMSVDSINVTSVEIIGDSNYTDIPIDLKYNKTNKIFDILARNANYRDEMGETVLRSVPMQIYHVPQSVFSGFFIGSGYGTRINNYHVWSIDPSLTNNFFGSGNRGYIAALYYYSPIQSYDCTEMFQYLSLLGKLEGYHKKYDKEMSSLPADEIKVETRETIYEFPYDCRSEY